VRLRRRLAGYFLLLPITFITVLQTGHEPLVAGLPFFMVHACGLFISRFALHLTQ